MNIKKMIAFATVTALLLLAVGCGAPANEPETTDITRESTAPVTESQMSEPEVTQPAETQPHENQPEIAKPEFPQGDYTILLETYWTALTEDWSIEQLDAKDLSLLCLFENGGDGLMNIGYAIEDISGEGVEDLIIASLSPDTDNVIFDLYTVVDGQIIHLCRSSERDRYYLHPLEDGGTASELIRIGSSGAGNSEWLSYSIGVMNPGELTIGQAIKYDTEADAENPWFMGYWDGEQIVYSPTDEDTANAIMNSAATNYYLPELTPFGK